MNAVTRNQFVTIVPPERGKGAKGYTPTQGTRLVLDDGSELSGVTKVVLTAETNGLWEAQVTLHPRMAVMKGMRASYYGAKPSWWRRALCRLAGVEIETTAMDSTRSRSWQA